MIFNLVITLIFLVFNSTHALDIPDKKNDVNVEIMPKNGIFMVEDSYYFGVKFSLQNGWKTYWKNPGDAGDSLSINWVDESNVRQLELLFPFPTEFIENQVTTIGYENEIIFPVKINKNRIDIIDEKIELNYLICKDICLPIKQIESLKLNLNNIVSSTSFNNNFDLVPKSNMNFFKLSLNKVLKDSVEVKIIRNKNDKNKKYSLFAFSEEASLAIDRNIINSDSFKVNFDEDIKNIKKPIFISISNGKEFEEIKLFIIDKQTQDNILYFLLLAMIGGIILNFMPCVLPVVSLKLYSLTNLSQKNFNSVRKSCSIVTFGILASFMLLASLVLMLKYFGNAVGWGFQFQNIYFLIFMVALLFLLSINLLGFFELLLPAKLNSSINNLINKNGYLGNFLTGFFATLLATPCSAPFLGTAVGFSMIASGEKVFLIFLFISIGFSMPYIYFIFFPRFISFLPKPGKWMVNFKVFLGVLMLLTAIWFLYLLKINPYIIFLIFFGVLFLSYMIERTRFKMLMTLGIAISSIFFLQALLSKGKINLEWEKFDNVSLQNYINENKVILIDVTADWCVTCQVNKLTTLQNRNVEEFILKNKIKIIRADWTDKNSKILDFISKYGRFGIPVNLVYGPKNKDGILLPEILSKDMLISKFNEAGLNEY